MRLRSPPPHPAPSPARHKPPVASLQAHPLALKPPPPLRLDGESTPPRSLPTRSDARGSSPDGRSDPQTPTLRPARSSPGLRYDRASSLPLHQTDRARISPPSAQGCLHILA